MRSMLPRSDAFFVGRDEELAALDAHRRAANGMVLTLVGTAGIGKTRLVREYLERLRGEATGIFVSLVEVEDESLVADRVVAACGIVPTGRDDLGRAMRRLISNDTGMVLAIDNAEHVMAGVVSVAEELATLDAVQVVVTSREPLGLENEHVYKVPPLKVDDAAQLLQSIAADRGVSVSNADAQGLAEVLDGLPLAIGLAAERTIILSPKQIQQRLLDSNDVLGRGRQDRHASLDAALIQSWTTLSPDERALCIGLSTFAHAFAERTAAEVWPTLDVAVLGPRLIAKSWLSELEHHGTRRWQMLHAVRAFVREQGTADDRITHEDRLVSWAMDRRKESLSWWAGQAREGLAAVGILEARGKLPEAASVLERLFLAGAYGYQAREVINHSVDLVEDLQVRADADQHRDVCGRLSIHIAKLSVMFAFSHDPRHWSQKALDMALNDAGRVAALSQLTIAYFDQQDRARAEATAHEGMALYDASDLSGTYDNERISWLLNFSITFHALGDVNAALRAIERGLAIAESSPLLTARCLSHKAFLLFDLARFDDCAAVLEQTREKAVELPDSERYLVFSALPAFLDANGGRTEEAKTYLRSLGEFAKSHDQRTMLFYHARGEAFLALIEGVAMGPPLERAYHHLALVDNNPTAIAEAWILLALNAIYEGRFGEAVRRITQVLDGEEEGLAGSPEPCRQMLRASRRVATVASQLQRGVSPSRVELGDDNAFEQIASEACQAITASIAGDDNALDAFDAACRKIDLAGLMIPGFFMFRYEQHVRGWVRAFIVRERGVVMNIERDCRAFEIEGERYDFSRKGTLRRLVQLLTQRAVSDPTGAIPVEELIHATWPEQTVISQSALNRAYSTINRLRSTTKLGPYLESTEHGYRLSSAMRIVWVDKL